MEKHSLVTRAIMSQQTLKMTKQDIKDIKKLKFNKLKK